MIDYKKAKDIIESNSMELIWTEEEFNSNYKSITITKIPVICSCNKQNTAKANGYEYEIWVYDHKGVKLN